MQGSAVVGMGVQLAEQESIQDEAVAVVRAYRDVAWDALERGDEAAHAALMEALRLHEQALRRLQGEGGELGASLAEGLERHWAQEVAPHLRSPELLQRLGQRAEEKKPMGDERTPRRRPTVTTGHTVRMTTGCGNLYVTINETEDGTPFELFNHMGKAGGCAASQNEAIGRLISYAMRCGASLEPLIKQIKGISCHRPAWSEDGKISSCSDAIGKALEKYCAHLPEQGAERNGAGPGGNGNALAVREAAVAAAAGAPPLRTHEPHRVQGACLDCGGQLAFEEGCVKCYSCGFTECS